MPFDQAVREEVIALQDTPAFQHSRLLRRKVEMLFGHMKKHFRFTRLKLRGLSGAAEEFLMMATVKSPPPDKDATARHPYAAPCSASLTQKEQATTISSR
ncbi:MAG: transposase [Acidobacteriia bacterium]|nr:transposase [Terriglobia bacterium]